MNYLASVLAATTLAESADAFMFSSAQKKATPQPPQTRNSDMQQHSLSRDLLDVFDTQFFSSMSPMSTFLLDDSWRMPTTRVFKTQIPSPRFSQDLTFNLDISETSDKYSIQCDLPGIKREDIEMNVLPNRVLEISCERKAIESGEEAKVNRQERYYGFVKRSLTLPDDVDEDHIAASYVDGVLDITIPKHPQEKKEAKKIQIADHMPSQVLPESSSVDVDKAKEANN